MPWLAFSPQSRFLDFEGIGGTGHAKRPGFLPAFEVFTKGRRNPDLALPVPGFSFLHDVPRTGAHRVSLYNDGIGWRRTSGSGSFAIS
jgi:hypothetical protein